MNLKKILKDNKRWIADKISNDSEYLGYLLRPQNPEVLYIGCSDSRVIAEDIMGAKPGDLFVYRNIANIVMSDDLSVMSTINYAVSVLKVKHIVVCGHYGCGGIRAAMDNNKNCVLQSWLKDIQELHMRYHLELENLKSEDKKYERMVELNVLVQCSNVSKSQVVRNSNNIQVHGWVFDTNTGRLLDLKY